MGRCLTLVFARKGGTFLYPRSFLLRCYPWIQENDLDHEFAEGVRTNAESGWLRSTAAHRRGTAFPGNGVIRPQSAERRTSGATGEDESVGFHPVSWGTRDRSCRL